MATKIGTVIDGKYEVLKQIGKGGMSVVYLAMDKRLNKQWAVKEIKKTANGKNDEIVINSLLAEANLMKRLDHPALPRIVDIIDNGQTLYVIMDYIEGESLDKILHEYGAQPEDLVINWAMQLCDALSYLHSQKPPIIYRDMKPGNVMLKPEGNIKVIDFGIAREYKEQNLADTTVLGTRGYASPEHYGSRQTDARSDIFTLGMTMHHLLTGIDPRTPDYMYIPVRQWNPALSEGIEYIINKCTAIDPENRYQNCDELMYDLQNPDQVGGAIKKKKKRKLISFIVSSAMAVVMAITGVTGNLLSTYEYNKDYETLVNISGLDSKKAIASCREAVAIYPGRADACRNYLQYITEDNNINKTELESFHELYRAFSKSYENEDDFIEVSYEAGESVFFYYNSENDSSLLERAERINHLGYFENINSKSKDAMNDYKLANSFYLICNHFRIFSNQNAVDSVTYDDYKELLDTFDKIIDELDKYDSKNSDRKKDFIAISFYKAIINTINYELTNMNLANFSELEKPVKELAQKIKTKVPHISNGNARVQEHIEEVNALLEKMLESDKTIETAFKNAAKEVD